MKWSVVGESIHSETSSPLDMSSLLKNEISKKFTHSWFLKPQSVYVTMTVVGNNKVPEGREKLTWISLFVSCAVNFPCRERNYRTCSLKSWWSECYLATKNKRLEKIVSQVLDCRTITSSAEVRSDPRWKQKQEVNAHYLTSYTSALVSK